jgi:hypothetical protein
MRFGRFGVYACVTIGFLLEVCVSSILRLTRDRTWSKGAKGLIRCTTSKMKMKVMGKIGVKREDGQQ